MKPICFIIEKYSVPILHKPYLKIILFMMKKNDFTIFIMIRFLIWKLQLTRIRIYMHAIPPPLYLGAYVRGITPKEFQISLLR